MKTALLILAGILATGVGMAQNLSIAKDQAKRASGQSGSQPASPHAPSAPAQAPMDPALAATLQNVASLRADFTAISAAADASAAADQRISLLNHLSGAAQGTKASTANVKKLASDFITALASRKKISPQSQKLAGAVHALFNGAHVSDTQLETLLASVTKLLTDAEVPADDAAKIVESLKAVAAETK